jgi:hypothetical protein
MELQIHKLTSFGSKASIHAILGAREEGFEGGSQGESGNGGTPRFNLPIS